MSKIKAMILQSVTLKHIFCPHRTMCGDPLHSKTSLAVWAGFSSRHQNATFKFKLKTVLMLVVVCWLRADRAASEASSSSSTSCTFDAETKRLWCSVGTLNGGRNNDSNIELQSANRAQHLTIQVRQYFEADKQSYSTIHIPDTDQHADIITYPVNALEH